MAFKVRPVRKAIRAIPANPARPVPTASPESRVSAALLVQRGIKATPGIKGRSVLPEMTAMTVRWGPPGLKGILAQPDSRATKAIKGNEATLVRPGMRGRKGLLAPTVRFPAQPAKRVPKGTRETKGTLA